MADPDCHDIQLEEFFGPEIFGKEQAPKNNASQHSPFQTFLRALAALVPLNTKDPATEARFKHAALGLQNDAALKEPFLKWLKERLFIKKVVAFALTIGAGLREGFTCLAAAYLSVLSGLMGLMEPLLKTYAFLNPEFIYPNVASHSNFFARNDETRHNSANAEILNNSSPQRGF